MELTRDLVAHTRDIYMVSVAGARPELFDGAEDVEALAEEAGLFGTADRLRARSRCLTTLRSRCARQQIRAWCSKSRLPGLLAPNPT